MILGIGHMKHILQVPGSLRVGGLETVAMNCMRYADRQYQFDYLVFGDAVGEYEAEARKCGCRVFHIPAPHHGYLEFYKAVRKIIRENGPYDAVHAHTFFNAGIVMRAAAKENVPLRIAHAHSVGRGEHTSAIKRFYNRWMQRWLVKYTTRFCACSQQAGEYLFTQTAFSERGILFPNAIEVEKYSFSEEKRTQIRDSFGIAENQIVLGQIGHLTKAKNQKFLLELFAEYLKSHDAVLLLVGDGELRDQLFQKAEELRVKPFVIFAGTRTDVPELLSAMDVFVCTSTHEGFGIVLIEAQANGLPCVVERETVVHEIRALGNCAGVDGFDTARWCRAIDASLGRRGQAETVQAVQNSVFSDTNLDEIISKIYH